MAMALHCFRRRRRSQCRSTRHQRLVAAADDAKERLREDLPTISRWRAHQGLKPLDLDSKAKENANDDDFDMLANAVRPVVARRRVLSCRRTGAVNVAHLEKRLQQTEEQLAQARYQLLVLKHQCGVGPADGSIVLCFQNVNVVK